MTLPTAAEVTSLFLFGTASPPQDKADPAFMQNPGSQTIQINRTDFMSSGPGRFGGPAQIEVVQKFFAGNLDFLFDNGVTHISLSQIQTLTNTAYEKAASIQQVLYQDGVNDLAERAYIYNNMKYTIVGDPVFVVKPDGSHEILNIATAPFDDNFDFVGGSPLSNLANEYLEPRVDPWQIGN
jgi:hypothetical protein